MGNAFRSEQCFTGKVLHEQWAVCLLKLQEAGYL